MGRERFTVAVARKIESLLEGNSLPSSLLPPWLVAELREEGLIVAVAHGSRCSFRLADAEACRRYIMERYTSGTDIDSWIELLSGRDLLCRNRLVQMAGDSKLVAVRSFRGFLVNCYEPIEASVDGAEFVVSPHEDTAVFIQNPDGFRIPADVVVVGVENGESFRYIRRQSYLFAGYRALFVSRYPQSADLREWLISIPNRYIHFGDFDLAGINIYQSEFYRYLGDRARFLVPDDIEKRLANGNSALYDAQYLKYKNLQIADSRLSNLYAMINRYRRVYEQEGYIV